MNKKNSIICVAVTLFIISIFLIYNYQKKTEAPHYEAKIYTIDAIQGQIDEKPSNPSYTECRMVYGTNSEFGVYEYFINNADDMDYVKNILGKAVSYFSDSHSSAVSPSPTPIHIGNVIVYYAGLQEYKLQSIERRKYFFYDRNDNKYEFLLPFKDNEEFWLFLNSLEVIEK